jgi:uncharacterized protein YlxW (UPF0749 family)
MEPKTMQTKQVESQPDFQQLLDSLRKETATARELTEKVSYYSNFLKQIKREPNPEGIEAQLKNEPTLQSIIEHLWEQVWELRRSNEEMQVVANHLQSIIGS